MLLISLLRVKHYSKNVFVLAALLFTRSFLKPHLVLLTLAAIGVMCLVGSATYIVNDAMDLERDRRHPRKKNRPLASGKIGLKPALAIAAICLVFGLALAVSVNFQLLLCALFYLAMQVGYNLKLKQVPIADVFVIATGFVLRVVVGAVAIQAQLSGWVLVCSASLALLLGFGKRRSEFLQQGEERSKSREALAGYTLQTLDAFVISSASIAILCYGIYGIESVTAHLYPGLILTIPVVSYGIFRYMLLIFGDADTSEPESIVFKDKQLAFTFVLFIAVAVWALSGLKIAVIS